MLSGWHIAPSWLVCRPNSKQAASIAALSGNRFGFGIGLSPWPDWALAWQSAGRTPEPWRGPDILQVIRDLGATGRTDGVLVCAQGFTSDHLEVLYDLDVEASRVATESGLAFARTRSIDDDPAVMGALADLVVARARAAGLD